jgi:CTP-dependent riboflavin kinase
MNKEFILTGTIISGVRQAAYFTQLDWVQDQCMAKLGFRPHPGTLNLEIEKDSLSVLEKLRKQKAKELIPTDPNFCTARVLPVSLESVKGAIIIPAEDVQVHGKNIVEILAPVSIKEALNVDDGDTIMLVIQDSETL